MSRNLFEQSSRCATNRTKGDLVNWIRGRGCLCRNYSSRNTRRPIRRNIKDRESQPLIHNPTHHLSILSTPLHPSPMNNPSSIPSTGLSPFIYVQHHPYNS